MKKLATLTIVNVISIFAIAWAVWVANFASEQWFYGHLWLVAVVLTVASLAVILSSYVGLRKQLVLPLVVTTMVVTSAQAGIFTPAGGDSANENPKGSYWSWLFHGWDFGWGFWRDGLDSWQSGHPVVNIDPCPPSNSDTSSK